MEVLKIILKKVVAAVRRLFATEQKRKGNHSVAESTSSNTSSQLVRLPPEIKYHIFTFLTPKDLIQLRRTCKHFAAQGDDEWIWKTFVARDCGPLRNVLAQHFGKDWKWIYRSKMVVFKSRRHIKDGDVGKLITKDGQYEGEWKNGELDGYGYLASTSGNIIEGQWRNGMGHGFGRVAYANGDLYAGQWTDGGVTGKGICYFMEGTVYKGDWKDNAVHGQGVCCFSDGNKYEGEWKMGKKDGKGVFVWKNGAKFKGQWQNNRAVEMGIHYCADGKTTVKTEWQNEFACCAKHECSTTTTAASILEHNDKKLIHDHLQMPLKTSV